MFTLSMGMDPADDRCLEMLSKVGVVCFVTCTCTCRWVHVVREGMCSGSCVGVPNIIIVA